MLRLVGRADWQTSFRQKLHCPRDWDANDPRALIKPAIRIKLGILPFSERAQILTRGDLQAGRREFRTGSRKLGRGRSPLLALFVSARLLAKERHEPIEREMNQDPRQDQRKEEPPDGF